MTDHLSIDEVLTERAARARRRFVVAFITASVAAYFVDNDEDSSLAEELRRLHARLDGIEDAIRKQHVVENPND